MASFIKSDLEFILEQIEIARRHTAGEALITLIQDPLAHFGLRTVDGSFNNVLPGNEHFGAADRVFPRLLPAEFRPADPVSANVGPSQPIGSATSYAQTSGYVFDGDPRLISNLIADQSPGNPAAVAVAGAGAELVNGSFFIENVAPDVGLSAPFNSWFTLFGQFFDHGLDLVTKGGSGTVVIPLPADDPLRTHGPDGIEGNGDEVPPSMAFMTLTRATNQPGPDGVLGNSDDVREHTNTTTPWVDQNQTYTSHPSHQVFLREYALNGNGDPVSTGRLLDGATGGIANWAEVKQQAAQKLGIQLTDMDVLNAPLLRTDAYGKFVPGVNGNPQLILGAGPDGVLNTADDSVREGDLANPVSTSGALRTGHAFLDDIAHTAAPAGRSGPLAPDGDSTTGNAPPSGTYDNELLDRHFITGDGRGNENIGLTAVHTVFHAEHNRLVEHIKTVAQAAGDPDHLAQWQLAPGVWDGEKLFQAARFGTEMQYQHLVFEEFARKVVPSINPFINYTSNIDPSIMAEFAHVVYRFGHSMLTETIDRIDSQGNSSPIGLIPAFLDPLAFEASGSNAIDATANIARGMTRQVGNEIDEFVTGALRNNLLGLPLDLPAINIARGRDTGVPGLNKAREMFYEDTGGNAALAPYENWIDFRLSMRNPESLVNYVAAYGTHPTIVAETTAAGKRAAAQALVDGSNPDGPAFMDSPAATSGVNDIDFWMGGLAEKPFVFGALLGSTFGYVFETQLEKLQDADRLYYLPRTAGLNFLHELEGSSFGMLMERNLPGLTHLPGDVFSTPAFTVELSRMLNGSGQIIDDPKTEIDERQEFVRMSDGTITYLGVEHIVMGGTSGPDRMRGSEGDDTFHGGGGNDYIRGGDGNDFIFGGDGDDFLIDEFGVDTIMGGNGNDVINSGPGGPGDLIIAGPGNDVVFTGDDDTEVFGGLGNDFIVGGRGQDTIFGNEGDDWIEGGAQANLLQGDNGNPFQNDRVRGNDVLVASPGSNNDFDAESGFDVMFMNSGVQRAEGMDGFDFVINKNSSEALDADLNVRFVVITDVVDTLRDRFDKVEGASGWRHNDILRGTDLTAAEHLAPNQVSGLNNAFNNASEIALFEGLQQLLGPGVTQFASGNILLGGAGSDLIEGRGGDDLIDGDSWLDVFIRIRDANSAVIGEADGMSAVIRNATFVPAGTTLKAAILKGWVTPDQLEIARRITTDGVNASDVDTAVFSGNRAEYTITTSGGRTMVAHTTPGATNDGTDTLLNIERLQFADGIVSLAQQPGTGTIAFSDATPTEGAPVTATATVSDPNSVSDAPMTFQWFAETSPGSGTFASIPGATDAQYTPAQADVLKRLQVRVDFIDGLGNQESVMSAPTGEVGDLIIGTASTTVPDTLVGTPYDDRIVALEGNDSLSGLEGDDILEGGPGNDLLDGGPGADLMAGGSGNDEYVVDDAGDVVSENAGEGTDTVLSSVDYALGPNVEHLTLTGGAVSGTGNALANRITGNALANTLVGGAGNDLLDGQGGADSMAGGLGNDLYMVDDVGDSVIENAGEGTDTVRSSVTYTLEANVERLNLIGDSAIDGTGNALANIMSGNAMANLLRGLAGNDIMNGGDGDDILVGGAGRDVLTGGPGADVFDYDLITDSPVGVTVRDIITDFLRGTDKIDLSDIDANTGTALDQAFTTWVGTAGFTGPQQLGYTLETVNTVQYTVIRGNVNNDTGADFQIALQGSYALDLTDFVL